MSSGTAAVRIARPAFGDSNARHAAEVRPPQLAVAWAPRRGGVRSSLRALLEKTPPRADTRGDRLFRDCRIVSPLPKSAFAAALACHVLFVVFPPPLWKVLPWRDSPDFELAHTQLAWYGPIRDLPVLLPVSHAAKPAAPVRRETGPLKLAAEAFHPRQSIFSTPLHPTHPRQTLIRPMAPPAPPKILPVLPNIVQWDDSQPAEPKTQLTEAELRVKRPKEPLHRKHEDATAPDLAAPLREFGPMDVAAADNEPKRPALELHSMSVPRRTEQSAAESAAAPQISENVPVANSSLIALSATPGPAAPPPVIPEGNLSARISISPDGGKNAASNPGSLPDAPSEAGRGKGPPGIFITGGNRGNASRISGLGAAATRSDSPAPPTPATESAAAASKPMIAQMDPSAPPESIFGVKRFYSMQINMPNLTSATGSWILNFAKLGEIEAGLRQRSLPPDLIGPVALHKVDPKYPPSLRAAGVEGEVVLYAIIRKDGLVDSIQLVRGVDPELDANAIAALAQWRFRPAEEKGAPIELEAVVHIPFRARRPDY